MKHCKSSTVARHSYKSALFIVDGTEGYGIRRFLLSIASATESGHCIFLGVKNGPLLEELRARGFEVLCLGLDYSLGVSSSSLLIKALEFARHRRRERIALKRALRLLRSRIVGSIHVGKPNVLSLAGNIALAHGRPPIYWMMHNALSTRYPLRINAWYLARAVRKFEVSVLANSHYTASTFSPFYNTIQVVHLGLQDSWAADSTLAPAFKRPRQWLSQDVVFGIFARLSPEKGHVPLLCALAALKEEFSWRLLIVGGPLPGAVAEEVNRISEREGVLDRVMMIGAVSDVRPYYACIDVAVNARVDAEPFGYSVLEAAALGKPVIAVGLGGVREVFDRAAFGWLAENGGVEALKNTIRLAIARREEWGQASESREKARYFSEGRMCEQYWSRIQRNGDALRGRRS